MTTEELEKACKEHNIAVVSQEFYQKAVKLMQNPTLATSQDHMRTLSEEVAKEREWLKGTSCTLYDIDIAFNAIQYEIKKMEKAIVPSIPISRIEQLREEMRAHIDYAKTHYVGILYMRGVFDDLELIDNMINEYEDGE